MGEAKRRRKTRVITEMTDAIIDSAASHLDMVGIDDEVHCP